MQLSQTTIYAIRITKYLSEKKGITKQWELAEEMNIPLNYLNKILIQLKEAGFVKAYQGPKGGYTLNKEASEISLLEVILVTEKTMKIGKCLEDGNCSVCKESKECRTKVKPIYQEIQEMMEEKLSVSFADLL